MSENLITLKWFTYNKYILVIILGCLFILGLSVYQADPYWLWNKKSDWHQKFKGGNRILDNKQRFTKLLQVVVQRPDIVILGSSRVYRGVDTETLNKIYPYKFYNMGISSLKITELEAFVEHIVKWTTASKIIIGLDFNSFRGDVLTKSGFNHDTGSFNTLINGLFTSHFSKMVYEDSMTVYKDTGQWKDGIWTFSGYKNTKNRKNDVIERIVKGHERSFVGVTIPEDHYAKLDNIVRLGRKEEVEVEFFLTPMTKRQIKAIKNAQIKKLFEKWRENLKIKFDEKGVIFFDLITGHPFLAEDLSAGSSNEWIDYNHYKPIIGSWIISQFF